MTMTQFAMVEELAFLVKDNLPSKHLILSMEETFVNFLQDETCSDGILELEPMDSYHRLLLHRLADIFGFSHVSVGEGVNRHLVLEQCPETSIPSILVSDILWEYDEPQVSTTPHQLLRRGNDPSVSASRSPIQYSLEERETAYLAARERIFTMQLGEDIESAKQKPRSDPVVARRMIAHALGHRINPCREEATLHTCEEQEGLVVNPQVEEKVRNDTNTTSEVVKSDQYVNSEIEADSNCNATIMSPTESNAAVKVKADKNSHKASDFHGGRNGTGFNDECLKREHLGAAKRMFSQALGKNCRKNDAFKNN